MTSIKTLHKRNVTLHMFAVIIVGLVSYALQERWIPLTNAYICYAVLFAMLIINIVRRIQKSPSATAIQEGDTIPSEERFFTVLWYVSAVSSLGLGMAAMSYDDNHAYLAYSLYYLNPIIMLAVIALLYKWAHYLLR